MCGALSPILLDDEETEKEAGASFMKNPAATGTGMDPKTPPFCIDLEEEEATVMRKHPTRRTVVKRGASVASSDDSSKTKEQPLKRKRRMQQLCSSSDEEEQVQRGGGGRACRRKAWISCQESDDETEASSHDKIFYQEELPLGVLQARAGSTGFQIIMNKRRTEVGRAPVLESAPVFYPTTEEFQDTLKYIESIRPLAEPYGICRVVPPASWKPPCSLKDNAEDNIRFTTRVQKIHKLQVREPTTKLPKKGRQRALSFNARGENSGGQEFFGFEPGPSFTIREFENYADELKQKYFAGEDGEKPVAEPSVETIEGEFWRVVEKPTEQVEVLYGADIETNVFKSGFPKVAPGSEGKSTCYEESGWNLNNIARLRGSVLEFEEGQISGVVVPWLYVGMCFSSFCWHVEDHHLYSVNYMHWGSPKVWYGVPGSAATKLEQAMKKRLPALFKEQPDLLHKLVTQLSPSILKEEGVPAYRVVQRTGEFVITFPRAYHAGFNCGFNCAEAVNVAPINWLPHGQAAVEIYKQQRRKTSISHDKLLLAAVKCAIKLSQSGAYAEQKQIIADALRARLITEGSRRASVASLKTVSMEVVKFDASDERECCMCAYDLHLSAVGCECTSELYGCLEHAMNFCKCPQERKFVVYRHDLSELEGYVRLLENRAPVIKLKINGPRPVIDLNLNVSSPAAANVLEAPLPKTGEMAVSQTLATINNRGAVLEPRSGPRIAKVVRPATKTCYDVDLVHIGRLVVKAGWHTKVAILPAGFRSRVQFFNYLALPEVCYYLSEVLDCTDGRPLFKVSMESKPSEKYVCSNIDFCWQSVQERVNIEIKKLRESGKTNLPPLRPPESLKGLEMFGLTVPSIVQAVEALDPKHLCSEYWGERVPLFPSAPSAGEFLTEEGKDELSELQRILTSKVAARERWLKRER